MNWMHTKSLIPNGVCTESKMPSRFVEGVYPKYIDRGLGAFVWSGDKRYVDYPCALGPVILGYSDKRVNAAIVKQLEKGIIFSLPNHLETEVAQKICDIIPCAEMVRFVKTGSESTSAAIKIARAYTKKNHIVACGYHGWHDWYNITTPKNNGVPRAMEKYCKQVKYNDLATIQEMLEKNRELGAVIMEPYSLEEPKFGYLQKIRELCTKYKVVLIFDEVVTAFRSKGLSAQKMFNVTPDLTTLGKAMANGMPIGCVCGKTEIMKVLEGDCFVSSTWGGELTALAAAKQTLEILENEAVVPLIWNYGERFIEIFKKYSEGMDGIGIRGYPCRTFFDFPSEELRSLFWQECCKRGVLFGYAQFISQSHNNEAMDITARAMKESLQMVKKFWDNPLDALEGSVAQATLRLITDKEKTDAA